MPDSNTNSIKKSRLTFHWLIAVILTVVLLALNIYLGDLNQDEGWYLYAADKVVAGEMPYKDFAYTQGPVMPYVYALAQ
ncbi:MAG: hypothetical protein GX811_13975, partial [Lentisphaerae bacterium]|nr:hypothetical protein [Lentisphaerota bacterium]